MPARAPAPALGGSILAAWRTNNQVTKLLVGHIPAALWAAKVPDIPTRDVRSIAAHFHNSRARWLRTLAAPLGLPTPPLVSIRRVTKAQLLAALTRSGRDMEGLLRHGIASGGAIPPTKAYTWRNLPLDVGHVLAYFVAHEAHHRGQLVMIARQLGHRLPREATDGLWQFTRLSKGTRH